MTFLSCPTLNQLGETICEGYIVFGSDCTVSLLFGSFLVYYSSTLQQRKGAYACLLRLAHLNTAFRLVPSCFNHGRYEDLLVVAYSQATVLLMDYM